MTFDEISLLKVEDMMTRKVLTIEMDASVLDASKKMDALNVGAIIVIDQKKQVVGIFSERDLLKRVCSSGKDLEQTKLSEIMTKELETFKSDTPISMAFKVMKNGNFRHAPIIDNNVLVGIISVKDINRVIYTHMAELLFEENKG